MLLHLLALVVTPKTSSLMTTKTSVPTLMTPKTPVTFEFVKAPKTPVPSLMTSTSPFKSCKTTPKSPKSPNSKVKKSPQIQSLVLMLLLVTGCA